MRKVNQEGVDLIKRWEGLELKAYTDSAGVLTIGYGHTSAAGAPKVYAGMTISEPEAEAVLKSDLSKFEERVSRLVKVPLTDNQFAALVSFDFNTGALHKSTLLKKLNAGNYEAVPGELSKWVNAGGKKLKGLVNRRAAEAGLWARGSFVSSNTQEVSKDKADTETVVVGTGGVGGAVATGGEAVIDVVTKQQDQITSGDITRIVVALIIVGLTVYFIYRKRRD